MPNYLEDLDLALDLADIADKITSSRFQSLDLTVTEKPDNTPVTDADLAVEAALRARLAEVRPTDAIIGEEQGISGDSNRCWVIDPIDGTKNFLRGVPVWATLIALMEDSKVVVGVVSAPALGRRWWASLANGAFLQLGKAQPKTISVSQITELANASLSYSSLVGWHRDHRATQFAQLMDSCWRTRAYGDFWSYMLLAEGVVDIAAEPELSLHDMAALDIIVREAGGYFGNVDGLAGVNGPGCLATNGLLQNHVKAILAK